MISNCYVFGTKIAHSIFVEPFRSSKNHHGQTGFNGGFGDKMQG